jgi:hypothetical protein
VLRKALKNQTVEEFESSCDYFTGSQATCWFSDPEEQEAEIRDQIKGKNYLGALSMQFESYAEKYKMPTVRKKLAEFVKKNFPKEIKV